jgi:hypothetical protein
MLVGVSGKQRVGKDTAGHYLEVKYGFRRIAFADVLKRYARKFGWNGQKDEAGRKFLQDLGMVIRTYSPGFWIAQALKQIEREKKAGYEDFVITDLRFRNEVAAIKEEAGIVVRLWSKDEITTDLHPSETELDDMIVVDYKIESSRGDFNKLYRQLDDMLVAERAKYQAVSTEKLAKKETQPVNS